MYGWVQSALIKHCFGHPLCVIVTCALSCQHAFDREYPDVGQQKWTKVTAFNSSTFNSGTEHLLMVDGVPVRIIRSAKRRKTASARVEGNGIVLRISTLLSARDAHMLAQNMVDRFRAKARAHHSGTAVAPIHPGPSELQPSSRLASHQNGGLAPVEPPSLLVCRQANPALHTRACDLSAQYLDSLARPESVRWVTNQTKRWGSATPATKTIRISTKLWNEPDWVLDYVLVHELAHLLVPNHSRQFWSWVYRYPYVERAKRHLEQAELRLLAF